MEKLTSAKVGNFGRKDGCRREGVELSATVMSKGSFEKESYWSFGYDGVWKLFIAWIWVVTD